MNEKMLQLLVTDSYLDKTNGLSKFERIYTQQINLRVANDSQMKDEVKEIVSTLETKEIKVKVVGSFRRNNVFLDELTFLVVSTNKKDTIKKCSEKIDFESVVNDQATRIIKIGTSYLFERFIFIHERDYIPLSIKNTGSSQFYKLYKERLIKCGINKINVTTEQELFDLLKIPYLHPELRDCVDDLTIPYSSFILDKNEKIKGNLIPLKKFSEYTDLKDTEYLGIYITLDEYLKFGKGIITLIKTSQIEGVNIYVGIKLDNIKNFDTSLQNEFDFAICGFDTNNNQDYTTLMGINKCIIINSFDGVLLANPLKTVLLKTDWERALKALALAKAVIGIDSSNLINSLHPNLLNIFKKNGGEVIVYNSQTNNFDGAIHLLRKALFSRKSLIHNHFRFRKMVEGSNERY